MRIYKCITLTIFIILFANFLFAQDDTIKVETNLVNLGVVVKNKKGEFVKGLKKDDFRVFDNNELQEGTLFSNQDEPVSLGIVYDLHPTTSDKTKIILNSLRSFSKKLPLKFDLFTIAFNENGNLMTDFVPTSEQLDNFLSEKQKNQPNSLYDVVFMATEKIRTGMNQKKMLLIISDGIDHASHHGFSELSKLLKSFNVQIYSVILDDQNRWEYSDITFRRRAIRIENSFLDQANLKELSVKSGGNSENHFIESEKVLTEIFNQMLDEMKNQYSIGFYPTKIDGKRHKLKVTVNSDSKQKFSVIYRKDYQGK